MATAASNAGLVAPAALVCVVCAFIASRSYRQAASHAREISQGPIPHTPGKPLGTLSVATISTCWTAQKQRVARKPLCTEIIYSVTAIFSLRFASFARSRLARFAKVFAALRALPPRPPMVARYVERAGSTAGLRMRFMGAHRSRFAQHGKPFLAPACALYRTARQPAPQRRPSARSRNDCRKAPFRQSKREHGAYRRPIWADKDSGPRARHAPGTAIAGSPLSQPTGQLLANY